MNTAERRVFTQVTMSVESITSHPASAGTDRSRRVSGDFISVGEALKLVPCFKGNKQEVLAFIGNVDTAFGICCY